MVWNFGSGLDGVRDRPGFTVAIIYRCVVLIVTVTITPNDATVTCLQIMYNSRINIKQNTATALFLPSQWTSMPGRHAQCPQRKITFTCMLTLCTTMQSISRYREIHYVGLDVNCSELHRDLLFRNNY